MSAPRKALVLSAAPLMKACSSAWAQGGVAAALSPDDDPAAHATDIAGSIRIPAAWTGLVGLKPTRGRVSWAPGSPVAPQGMACELVVTRSVRDTAAILDLLAGPEPLTDEQIARATWLVEQAGGRDQTETMAARALDGAFAALGRAEMADDVRAELSGIAEFITARQW